LLVTKGIMLGSRWSRWWLGGCLPGQIKSNISKWNKVEAV